MIRPFFLALAVLAIGLPGQSAAAASVAVALHTLSRIDTFALGGIGVAGTISPGETAFREILADRHAINDFQTLLKKGSAPAQCYALVALHVLSPNTFKDAAAPFETTNTPVKTIGGCIISTVPMRSVVANISKGNYDLYLKPLNP